MPETKHRTDIAVPLQRRNFILNVINGAFSAVAMRTSDAGTVLPLLIYKLAGAEWAVGLGQAVQDLGRVSMQLPMSRVMDAVPRKMPLYMSGSVGRIVALSVCTGALLLGVDRDPRLVLLVFMIGLFCWMLLNGVSELAWMDVTARSVPSNRRGSLMTGRKFLGMILALVLATPLVKYYLGPSSPLEFPANYGALYVITIVFFGIAWGTFSLTREPESHAARRTLTVRHHFARGLRVLRRDPLYKRLLWLRVAMGITGAFSAFFITFGKVELGLADHWAALFLSIKLVSEMLSSVVFGRISDKMGNRATIVTTTVVTFATAGLAVLCAWLDHAAGPEAPASKLSIVLLGGVFCGFGVVTSGRDTGEFNYLLDIAPAAKRPSYIGFGNAFLLPLSLLPLLIGWLIPAVGYLPLFGFAALVSLSAVVVAVRMAEPRDVFLAEPEGAD